MTRSAGGKANEKEANEMEQQWHDGHHYHRHCLSSSMIASSTERAFEANLSCHA